MFVSLIPCLYTVFVILTAADELFEREILNLNYCDAVIAVDTCGNE